MLNYYEILGISRNADERTIKSAFKKLALKYHPDKNPGNIAAEEYFKQLNEAYQILSHPDKKRRYDFILNYSIQSTSTSTTNQQSTKYTYHRPQKETTIYNRYGKYDWRKAPRYKKAPKYRIDKNYFKLQALALAIMAVFSVIVLAANMYWNYKEEQKQQAIRLQNELALKQAQTLYHEGKYRKALDLVITLYDNNPIESIFYQEREKMVSGLFQNALANFNTRSFEKAVSQLEIVKDYERPMKMQTWEMLADAYYQLKDYEHAVAAFDHILERDKNNIRLAVKLARIYKDDLHNEKKALEYYAEAKLLFKEFQSSTYGNAFELVVEPSQLPDFYFELFVERAHLNYAAKNYEEAITDCNWAIFLRPQVGELYNIRAHCKRNIGLNGRACKDWKRAIEHGHLKSKEDLNKYCQ